MTQEIPVPPLSHQQLETIMNAMTSEDKKHFNEIRTFRLSEELYLYILKHALKDGITFDEWVRSACISYALQRTAQRNTSASPD